MIGVFQSILVQSFHQQLVVVHVLIFLSNGNPVELYAFLSLCGKFGIQVGVGRECLHVNILEVDSCREESHIVEQVWVVG